PPADLVRGRDCEVRRGNRVNKSTRAFRSEETEDCSRGAERRLRICVMLRIEFSKLRFLVVDDNAHMRRILRTLLHGFGAREVYEAEDGATGLDAFTHFMPDIVLV